MAQETFFEPNIDIPPFKSESRKQKDMLQFFEGITTLTKALFPACSAYISLTSNDKLKIISYHGNIDPHLFNKDLAGEYCLMNNCFTEVTDIREDDRFSKNAFTGYEQQAVSFAGMPLINADGFSVGILAVISHQPMQLSKDRVTHLQILAGQVVAELSNQKEINQLGNQLSTVLKTVEFFEETNRLAGIGRWEIDPINNNIFWSAITRTIHGVSDNFLPDLPTWISFYKEGKSREKIINCVNEAILHNISFDEELQITTKTGLAVWVRAKGDPVFADRKCVRIFGTFQDIQQQKEQEEIFKASEIKYRSIIENSLTANLLTDPAKGSIIACNTAAATMFGYSTEEMKQQRRQDVIDVDDPNSALLAAKRNSEGKIQGELTGIRKTGERFPILYSSAIFTDTDGETKASMTCIDISTLKKVVNELRQSKEEFSTAFDFASIGMALVSLEGKWLRVNKSLCNMLGYSKDELLGMDFQQITYPEDLTSDLKQLEQLVNGTIESYKLEKRYFTKAGNIIWINLSVSLVTNAERLPQHFISQIENITERKTAELELIKEKETLANVIDGTNAATWEWNIQTRENVYSDRWAEMLGYTLGELKPFSKYTWIRLTHPDDRKISNRQLHACINKETEYYDCEYRMKHKEGHWVWVLDRGKITSFTPDGKPFKMFGIHLDITLHKNVYDALEQKQALIETIINTINVGILACDSNGVKILFNAAAREICCLPDSQGLYENWAAFNQMYQPDGITPIHPDESPLYRTLIEGELINLELMIKAKDRQPRLLIANGRQIKDKSGNVNGAVLALHDITDRKKSEQALAFSERRFKGIFNSTFSFIGFLAPDGTLLEANETIIRFSGVKPELVINKKLWDCYWGQISMEGQQKLQGKIERAAKGEFLEYELEIESSNGKPLTILFNLKPLFDDDGKVIAIVSEGRPIQEIVDARKALLEKNVELEQFAFIASHDLKEPLRMVHSFMGLLRDNYKAQLDVKAQKYIDYAFDGSQRMTEMVSQLLTYARVGSDDAGKELIDTNELLQNILALQRAVMEEKEAQLNIALLPQIYGWRTPLTLLFQNLIANAVKYQLAGVKPIINITTRETTRAFEFALQDNGIGIPTQHQGEIFQLFKRLHTRQEFTGTGMGLATCKKIVELHGGKIWVESKEGKGSTFYFTIEKSK